MKTLDEVIKANECCDDGDLDSRCEDCPYSGIGACLLERKTDALHYLKEYRDMIKKLENYQKENQRLKKRVEKLESDAAWDVDNRRGQVQGMW